MAKEVSRKTTQTVQNVNYTVELSLDEVIFLFGTLSQCCGVCSTEEQRDITLRLYQFFKGLIGGDSITYSCDHKLTKTEYQLKDDASHIVKEFKKKVLESLNNENLR
jgi:hypothetical protein